MKMKLNLIALLALSGLGLTGGASAATTVYNNGDLIMGFRQDGNATAYLLDLGSAATVFRDFAAGAPVSSFAVSGLGNIAQDLSNIFGNDWYTATPAGGTVYWGVVGTPGATAVNGDAGSTLYASKPEAVYGTPETGYTQANNAAQAVPRSAIVAMDATYTGQTSTANSNVGYAQPTSTTNGWDSKTSSGLDFGYFNNLEGTDIGSSALDLFRMATSPVGQAGSYEGSFFFTGLTGAGGGAAGGTLNFGSTTAAVPEPSRALLAAMGAMGLVLRRRRPAAKA